MECRVGDREGGIGPDHFDGFVLLDSSAPAIEEKGEESKGLIGACLGTPEGPDLQPSQADSQ
jgi:hypothetical protein